MEFIVELLKTNYYERNELKRMRIIYTAKK